MTEDIRDKAYLEEDALPTLNFIRTPLAYVFRRHYRQGLRSHIMEVLDPQDVERETKGTVVDGVRCYPRAVPLKMLRIFRTRFRSLREAQEELSRVKIVLTFLSPDHLARSEEFLVTYRWNGEDDMLLCGLQEYVKGEILDPWGLMEEGRLLSLLRDSISRGGKRVSSSEGQWMHRVREKAGGFIASMKKFIGEAHHVPDLAGVGNLILSVSGDIKLVDINNISRVWFDDVVRVDDRGYPVCDKSIQALFLLEEKLLQKPVPKTDAVYSRFLDPERMKEVASREKAFHHAMKSNRSYLGTS